MCNARRHTVETVDVIVRLVSEIGCYFTGRSVIHGLGHIIAVVVLVLVNPRIPLGLGVKHIDTPARGVIGIT